MKSLLIIDYINEIVHPDGKLAGQWYTDFIAKHKTLENVSTALQYARQHDYKIIWVRLGFHEDYSNCSTVSPRFAGAPKFGILKENTWSTQFIEAVHYLESETTLTKTRVSPFYKTWLEEILRETGVTEIFIAGVATDLAVTGAVREAHDRDFKVTVIADACAATNETDHSAALLSIGKLATITSTSDFTSQ